MEQQLFPVILSAGTSHLQLHVKAFLWRLSSEFFSGQVKKDTTKNLLATDWNRWYEVIHLLFIFSDTVNYIILNLYQYSGQLQVVWRGFGGFVIFVRGHSYTKCFSSKADAAKTISGAGYAFLTDFYELKRHTHKYKLSSLLCSLPSSLAPPNLGCHFWSLLLV